MRNGADYRDTCVVLPVTQRYQTDMAWELCLTVLLICPSFATSKGQVFAGCRLPIESLEPDPMEEHIDREARYSLPQAPHSRVLSDPQCRSGMSRQAVRQKDSRHGAADLWLQGPTQQQDGRPTNPPA